MAPLPYDGTGLKPVKKASPKKAAPKKKKESEGKSSAQESED